MSTVWRCPALSSISWPTFSVIHHQIPWRGGIISELWKELFHEKLSKALGYKAVLPWHHHLFLQCIYIYFPPARGRGKPSNFPSPCCTARKSHRIQSKRWYPAKVIDFCSKHDFGPQAHVTAVPNIGINMVRNRCRNDLQQTWQWSLADLVVFPVEAWMVLCGCSRTLGGHSSVRLVETKGCWGPGLWYWPVVGGREEESGQHQGGVAGIHSGACVGIAQGRKMWVWGKWRRDSEVS